MRKERQVRKRGRLRGRETDMLTLTDRETDSREDRETDDISK